MDRVLAFGCHPDDVEFMAAGTLCLLAQCGFEIHVATMTGGDAGHPTLAQKEIREIRLREAETAAAILGATYHYAGGNDLEVDYSAEYRRMAVRVMREVDPLIVLTHPPMDYLIDHEETSRLVRTAAFAAPVPNYAREDARAREDATGPASRVPYLYYWNALGLRDIFGRPLPLTCVVNITSVIDRKAEALACHASQREWLAYINKWDAYIENMRDQSCDQGVIIGAAYGEGFIQHLGCGHPADNILGAVLKERCVDIEPGEPGGKSTG